MQDVNQKMTFVTQGESPTMDCIDDVNIGDDGVDSVADEEEQEEESDEPEEEESEDNEDDETESGGDDEADAGDDEGDALFGG